MTDKQIIDGKECRYWFRPNPDDYRKCSLRGKNDNCDEITDCFIKELLGKLALKEQECEELKHEVELMMDCASCKVDEYKQTLAEIKEIAETISLPMGTGKSCNRVILAKQILQKISKVKNANI